MRRSLSPICLLLVLVSFPVTADAAPDTCTVGTIEAGDLLLVRFAPALAPGSADLFDLFVAGAVTDLCGVSVTDGEGTLTVGRVPVEQGDVVRFVSAPDLVLPEDPRIRHQIDWSASDAPLERTGRFALAKGGDHLSALWGEVAVDSVVYGDGDPARPGWSGDALEGARIEQRMFLRGTSEDGYRDTDQATDWHFPRIYRQYQDDRAADWQVAGGEVRAFTCPDRCFEEVLMRIDAATERIDVNLYDLSHREATEALAAAAERDVAVRVLLQDRPVGASNAKMDRIAWAADTLGAAGAEVRTLDGARFDFNHAKYLLVDGLWTVVLSENGNAHGWPVDGADGNRGWGVAVQDGPTTEWMGVLFERDHLHPHDSRAVTGAELHADAQPPRWGASGAPPADRLETLVLPPGAGVRVRPVVAPDHLGDPGSSPLVRALHDAETELWTQQLNLPLDWRRNGYDAPSPLTEALLQAGGRGVQVRGTLADSFVDGDVGTAGNDQTAYVLRESGRDIEVLLAGRAEGQVVHNKGWLVDPVAGGRNLAVVGSANGNLASQTLNREVTLFLEHPDVAAYYRGVLEADWVRAGGDAEAGIEEPVAAAPIPMAFGWVVAALVLLVAAGRRRSLDMPSLRRPLRRR